MTEVAVLQPSLPHRKPRVAGIPQDLGHRRRLNAGSPCEVGHRAHTNCMIRQAVNNPARVGKQYAVTWKFVN